MTTSELIEEYDKIMNSQELEINKLKQELEQCKKIIKEILYAMPVGNISTHTPENLPGRVQYWVQEAADECRMREKWEELADSLMPYAKDFARYLEGNFYTSDPFASHKNYQVVSNVITQYEKLKNYE